MSQSRHHFSLCFARVCVLALALVLVSGIAVAHERAAAQVFMYTQDLKRDPSNVDLYLARGRALAELARVDEAAADFRRVMELDPTRNIARFDMGKLFAGADRHEDALHWFDEYARLQPETAGAHIWRGRTLGKLGRDADAVSAYGLALEKSTQPSPETIAELAEIHARMGNEGPLRAIETLDAGMKRIGNIITLELRALDLELSLNKLDAALTRLDRIIAGAPRKETYLARRAEILRKVNREDEARRDDSEALRLIEALSPSRRSAPVMKELEAEIRSRMNATQPETTTATP